MPKPARQVRWQAMWMGLCLLAGTFSSLAGAPGSSLPSPRGSYAFKAFGHDQGLLNTSITGLARDRENTIWVGTEDGLFRLEGQRFRRFGQDEGLPSSYVSHLIAPKDGGLWVVTNLGLAFWDGKGFQRPSERGIPGADDYTTSAVLQSGVVPVEGFGLLFTREEVPRLVTGRPGFRLLPELQGLLRAPMNAWGSIEGQEMLLASHRELLGWQNGKVHRRSLDRAITSWGWVAALMRDRRGGIWIRTERALLSLPHLDASPTVVSAGTPLGMTNYGVDLREDPTGRIWTGTSGGLFWHKDGDRGHLGAAQGLPESGGNFHFVFDGEGSLWVATEALLMQQGRFLWSNHSRPQGLPANMVWRIARGSDGRLWAATQSGLAKAEGGRWLPVPHSASRVFFTVMPDREGNLWMAGYTNQDPVPVLWEVRPGMPWPHSVPLLGISNPWLIWEMAFDERQGLWLATRNLGLLHGHRTPRGWQMEQVQVPGWPLTQNITLLINGPEESLWVASELGVAVREKDGRWQVFQSGVEIPRPIAGAMRAAPSGAVWVSYAGDKELTVFRRLEGRWKVSDRVLPPNPLVQENIMAIGFEPDGTLVLGTSRGIKRWDGRKIEQYGREWGLAGEDVAQGCLWRDPNGDWWVGTTAGISHFDRSQYQPPPPLSPIRIQRVLAGNAQELPLSGHGGQPRIPHRSAHLVFHLHPEGYLGTVGAKIQVRLRGSEDQWRESEALSAAYSALAPGRYAFETRLLGRDGTEGPVSAFAFEILPPWYWTWWALSLLAVIFLGGLLGLHRLRTRHLRHRAEHLEALVSERTAELGERTHQLEHSNLLLTNTNAELAHALAEVKTLRGLIPICMYCKKIRSDGGFWNQLETYLSQRTEARFSHGVCPECIEKEMKEYRGPDADGSERS